MKFGYFNPRDYLDKYKYGIVESPEIFIKGTQKFHPKGLFSTEIFGQLTERQFKKGIILFPEGFKVLHPEFYDVLQKRSRNIYLALRGEIALKYNPKTGNLEPAGQHDNPEQILIGLSVIRFILNCLLKGADESTNTQICEQLNINPTIKQLILAYKDKIWIDSLFIIPPADRDILIENGKILHIHPINNLYANLIKLLQTITFDFDKIYRSSGSDTFNYLKQLFVWLTAQDLVYQIQQAVRSILAGKQGFIRSVVLGKRLDFTARAVIIPNPNLKHWQAGIPYKILAKIFEPFVIHVIMNKIDPKTNTPFKDELRQLLNIAITPNVLRTILTKFRDDRLPQPAKDVIKRAIDIAVKGKVVLLKRDPALHRLSIEAFEPVPVEGNAIQVPPQVDPPFNADHDGDSALNGGFIFIDRSVLDTVNAEHEFDIDSSENCEHLIDHNQSDSKQFIPVAVWFWDIERYLCET